MLNPIHPSMQPRLVRKPSGMTKLIGADPDAVLAADKIALAIFTDCANAGVPFHQCLTALYLSGLQHGKEVWREE